ncbi:MAG: sulfotransferase [Acidimicrobiales bacterium]|jgi:hypothetical protein
MTLPDFFVAGAPKAGTSALHAALARHPELSMSRIKEPKYYLCDGRPPPRGHGPGDPHSSKEWIWERSRYEALFPTGSTATLRGESTPFYLSDPGALARILRDVPHARFVCVLRDPIDRAYSNWAHLWADGLEPVPDFLAACAEEERRRKAGWAPMWRYVGSGRYGEQLQDLYRLVPRERVHLLRYRELVDRPTEAVAAICEFLGVAPGLAMEPPGLNVGTYVPPTRVNAVLRASIRGGAAVGSLFPPRYWRKASVPFLRLLQRSPEHRPDLTPAQREELAGHFVDDVALLESLTGESFQDWLGSQGRGTYSVRKSWAPSRREVS